MTITAALPLRPAFTQPAAPQQPTTPRSDTPASPSAAGHALNGGNGQSPTPACDTVERVTTGIGRVAGGAVVGLTSLLANGCAGGARGIVRGAGLVEQKAEDAFQIGFAANLLVLGGALYGAASALGALVTGQETWKHQLPATREKVFTTVDHYVDAAVAGLPATDAPSAARRLMQGAMGEGIGLVAGAIVGAESGYRSGSAMGERATRFVTRKVREAMA